MQGQLARGRVVFIAAALDAEPAPTPCAFHLPNPPPSHADRPIVVLMMENNGFDRILGWMGSGGRDVDGVDPSHPALDERAKAGLP
jgi:hypothetical protein